MKRVVLKEVRYLYHVVEMNDEIDPYEVVQEANDHMRDYEYIVNGVTSVLEKKKLDYGFEYDVQFSEGGEESIELTVDDIFPEIEEKEKE